MLRFVTGTPKVPVEGFAALKGSGGECRGLKPCPALHPHPVDSFHSDLRMSICSTCSSLLQFGSFQH